MEEKCEVSTEQASDRQEEKGNATEEEYVAPGVAVVRTNTPRPLPFSLISARTELPLLPSIPAASFPLNAPEAPPLPEEEAASNTLEVENAQETLQILPAAPEIISRVQTGEFIWLFEYALDMDPVRLNRPERLDGSAFAYGPAVLKDHQLVFEGLDARTGQVLASLIPIQDQREAEVWGVLYRVPRRLAAGENNETSLLDKVHTPEVFVPVEIRVCESYRQREITCITYVASENTRKQVSQLPLEKRVPEPAYLKRLLHVARRQKLPASYLCTLEELAKPVLSHLSATPPEQNTEPLAAVIIGREPGTGIEKRTGEPLNSSEGASGPWNTPYPAHLERWLMTFAIYVSLCLVCALMLAIVQGMDFASLSSNVTALGIPWYTFLYGLLGGCISCIISLGRPCRVYPPAFVVLTWFARPFLGAFLGALAYLVLNSGLILVSTQSVQHLALCSITSTLAGLCEGRILPGKTIEYLQKK